MRPENVRLGTRSQGMNTEGRTTTERFVRTPAEEQETAAVS